MNKYVIFEYAGIPALQEELYEYGGPNEDDHQYHEFAGVRDANEQDTTGIEPWGSVDALLYAMKKASQNGLKANLAAPLTKVVSILCCRCTKGVRLLCMQLVTMLSPQRIGGM